MPTYGYKLYQPQFLDFQGGPRRVTLDANHDFRTNIQLDVTDNDSQLDGDSNRDEEGNDLNQYGIATYPDGTVIGAADTTVYSETQYRLVSPDGEVIMMYRIEIDQDPDDDDNAGTLIGYLPERPLEPGVTYRYTTSNTTSNNGGEYEEMLGALCLTAHVMVTTTRGERPVKSLRVGDMVLTRDNGYQPIRWIGERQYRAGALKRNPRLRPVRIGSGALGQGLPRADLLVSRQHRMLLSSRIAQRMFGVPEVLIPAIRLTALRGIEVAGDVNSVRYFHILFDAHQVIFAEGAPTESLYTGPEAMRGLPSEMRDELLEMFPELAAPQEVPDPAHPIPPRERQKELVYRHLRNNRPVLEQLH